VRNLALVIGHLGICGTNQRRPGIRSVLPAGPQDSFSAVAGVRTAFRPKAHQWRCWSHGGAFATSDPAKTGDNVVALRG
jgi:hypothetical protein